MDLHGHLQCIVFLFLEIWKAQSSSNDDKYDKGKHSQVPGNTAPARAQAERLKPAPLTLVRRAVLGVGYVA